MCLVDTLRMVLNLIMCTVVPVMNGHPRDQAKVSVHCRWPLIRGNLTLKCVGRGIDNVAVQGRWPLTTGVAQGRYYCTLIQDYHRQNSQLTFKQLYNFTAIILTCLETIVQFFGCVL